MTSGTSACSSVDTTEIQVVCNRPWIHGLVNHHKTGRKKKAMLSRAWLSMNRSVFVMLLKQACLFEKLIQGIGPAVYFDAKLPSA